MLGNPKYKIGDKVIFELSDDNKYKGKIYIIDKYGTFEDPTNVSYDILIEPNDKYPNGCLYKHISEHLIIE